MTANPIWQMKYCTKTVLVATSKISGDKTYIYFIADRNYPDLYSVESKKVRNYCQIVSNGKIPCYSIPIEMLYNEGELPETLQKQREIEYERFKKYKSKK